MAKETSSKKSQTRRYRRGKSPEVLSVQFDGARWQNPDFFKQEYKVSFTLYDSELAADTDVGSPISFCDATVMEENERKAVEAALAQLQIPWQGSDGKSGAIGIGSQAYLLRADKDCSYVLVWSELSETAKLLAGMPITTHAYSVGIKEIPPTAK